LALTDSDVYAKYQTLKSRHGQRDSRMADAAAVRRGQIEQIAPGLFPTDWPKSIIANFIDTAARDLAEVIAPLPSFNCSGSSMVSDAARKFQDKRTKIANYYLDHSDVERQAFSAADRYLTYGFKIGYVEPDLEAGCPRITLEDPMGAYLEWDRWNRPVTYLKRFEKTVGELAAMFPEHARAIRGDGQRSRQDSARIEMVRYVDADCTILFLPQQGLIGNRVLSRTKNPLGRIPIATAVRPGLDDEQRGQFDDVVWIQIARARMALLALEAAEKSVQAPIVATPDMQEMAFGPDAILYSQSPEKVRRLPVEIPQSAFAEMSNLGNELRLGARYPEGRTGSIDASVVTGRGVQQLLAGFDTQVKTAQALDKRFYTEVIALCFEMDEKFWPSRERTIRGTQLDAPYEVTYRPRRDIKGDYTVDVTYGMAAGMDPNRALVFLLQMRGDKMISRDFALRQMPFNVNVTEELARIDVEELRDATKQGIAGLAAGIPQLIAAGQDPIQVLSQMAMLVQFRQKGLQVEDAAIKAFTPPEPPPAPEGALPGEAATAPGSEPGPLTTGTAPGQEGLGAGGAPDLQMLLAGLTGKGEPNLQAAVSRRLPA